MQLKVWLAVLTMLRVAGCAQAIPSEAEVLLPAGTTLKARNPPNHPDLEGKSLLRSCANS